MARDLKRINMNMPSDLLEQVDTYAEKMGVNRSSAINMLVSTALEQKSAISTIENIMQELKKANAK